MRRWPTRTTKPYKYAARWRLKLPSGEGAAASNTDAELRGAAPDRKAEVA